MVEAAIGIVENKKTDEKTSSDKEAEWLRLTVKFNAKFPADNRTFVQLMNCWKNLKRAAKEEFAKARRSKLVTGGGESEPDPQPICVKVAALVPGQIHPLPNRFDSDAPLDLTRKNESDTDDTNDTESADGTDEVEHGNVGETHIPEKPKDNEAPENSTKKDKLYGHADFRDAEYHRVRMRKLRLKMQIAKEAFRLEEDRRNEAHRLKMERKDKEHELALESKRRKIAFWTAQTASLQALDDKIAELDDK